MDDNFELHKTSLRSYTTGWGNPGAVRVHGLDPFLDTFLTIYVGERIVRLDRTTRRVLRERLRTVFAEGQAKSASKLRDPDDDLDDGTLLGALLTDSVRFATGGSR